jgi:RimJ/RimL family protein N-acetyltransferase
MILFLESSNVILSPISNSLIEQGNYSKWINDQESDLYTQHAITPHTLESIYTHADNKNKSRNSIWLGIIFKEDNKHIGNIDISEIDWINRVGTYNIIIGDKNYQGKGIGKIVLIDALKRSYEISQKIGSFAIVVDPIDEEAENFYKKYDFIKLPDSKKMFIATKTLQELFG